MADTKPHRGARRACAETGAGAGAGAGARAADEAGIGRDGETATGAGAVSRDATSVARPVARAAGGDATELDIEFVTKCARGWETTEQEHCFWFTADQIVGHVPADLRGTFLRNGPGVSEVYGHPLKHPIDGDGMVCALTFVDGKAHFRSRFVQSRHRMEEAAARQLLYKGQMGTEPRGAIAQTLSAAKSLLLHQSRPRLKFRNPSNTNVFYWGGKVLTCYETGLPHNLDPVTLETIGLDTLNDTLEVKTFAAHFRYDSTQDKLVTLSLMPGLDRPGTICFYEYDREWNCMRRSRHTIDGMNYAHDFLLTPNWYIVQMTPFVKLSKSLVFKIMCGLASAGDSMRYYPDLPCRIVLIPRSGEGDVLQFDTEPCHIFHFGNVHDSGDKLDFSAVCIGKDFNMEFSHRVWLSNADVAPGHLFRFHIDLKAGKMRRDKIDDCSCEFPSVHPYRHIGQHGVEGSRFVYLMANDRGKNLPYQDVVKVDETGGTRDVFYTSGCVGEPVFVPRAGPSSAHSGAEDDGYVLVQMYDPNLHVTEFLVLDAQRLSHGPVCRLRLPTHITYGFHGTFTPEVFTLPPSRL